jgi:hypothetical protein
MFYQTKMATPKHARQAWFGILILNSGADHKKKEIKQLNFDKTIADVVSNVCHCASSSVKTWIAVKDEETERIAGDLTQCTRVRASANLVRNTLFWNQKVPRNFLKKYRWQCAYMMAQMVIETMTVSRDKNRLLNDLLLTKNHVGFRSDQFKTFAAMIWQRIINRHCVKCFVNRFKYPQNQIINKICKISVVFLCVFIGTVYQGWQVKPESSKTRL